MSVFAEIPKFQSRLMQLTVANLQELIRKIGQSVGISLKASGKKAEIVARIMDLLELWRTRNDVQSFNTFKTCYNLQKDEMDGNKSRYREMANVTNAYYGNNPPAAAGGSYKPYGTMQTANSWDNRASTSASAGQASAAYSRPQPPALKKPTWRNSPMIEFVKAISPVIMLPASASASDRKSATSTFVLEEDVRAQLRNSVMSPTSTPQYSLRIYCTPQSYFTPALGHLGPALRDNVPNEFPGTAECRVNGYQIASSLKGVKKKLGSCPPANLHKPKHPNEPSLKLEAGERNTVELIHINQNQTGGAPKLTYYFQICLVRAFSPADLVQRVQSARHRAAQEVITELTKTDDEDEIEHGSLTLTLKCPLSYIRMANPMRSTQCNHIQCFDASSWFQINEQTPTWACPVCEKVLRLNELFIDDYTATIIKTVPSSMDEVIVEPNAQWHTTDRKFGDPAWLADPANSVPVSRPVSLRSSPVGDAKGKGREQDNVEVFVLDSDDEDDDEGHAPYAPDYVVSRDVTPLGNVAEPIDLTLSSDEDSPPRPPAAPSRASSSSINNVAVPGAAGGSSAGVKRSATEEVASGPDKRGRYEDERGQGSASREEPSRAYDGYPHDPSRPISPYERAPAAAAPSYYSNHSRPTSGNGAPYPTSAAAPAQSSFNPPPRVPSSNGWQGQGLNHLAPPGSNALPPRPPSGPPAAPPAQQYINPDLRPAPTYYNNAPQDNPANNRYH